MRVDPITFNVVNNALVGVAEQMAATILRTSYSTVVREMLDYSTAVFDPEGHIIAQSCRIPIHLNSMSRSLRTTLDGIIPIEEWNEGDIIITNDPYLGGQHLPDVQTFMPVYSNGKIVAICGTLDHHLDLGGMRPGSYAGDAVEIFQEGFRIPPFKLFERLCTRPTANNFISGEKVMLGLLAQVVEGAVATSIGGDLGLCEPRAVGVAEQVVLGSDRQVEVRANDSGRHASHPITPDRQPLPGRGIPPSPGDGRIPRPGITRRGGRSWRRWRRAHTAPSPP